MTNAELRQKIDEFVSSLPMTDEHYGIIVVMVEPDFAWTRYHTMLPITDIMENSILAIAQHLDKVKGLPIETGPLN